MIRTFIKRLSSILFCAGLFPVFFSCSPVSRLDGYLHLRLAYNPTTLDPAFIVDVSGGSIAAKLFNGLVRLDNNLYIIPDIAERWEVSDEGTLYVFYLKRGVVFSNGREVVSSDFRNSFKRILDPKGRSPNTWVFDKILGAKAYMAGNADDITGIEAPDSHTLKIRLEKPFSPFLHLLTMTAAYVVPHEAYSSPENDFAFHPVGTGPFVLERWRQNTELLLKKNKDYFGREANIAGIVYRIIPEDMTALAEFEIGNIDAVSIPASDYSAYLESPTWNRHIVTGSALNTYYLGFNCLRPPFDNISLRKAVAYSIDREKILEGFFEKRGTLAKGPVPDILRTWDHDIVYKYDPEAAGTILEEPGLQNITINFYITAEQEVADISEIIQYYLKKTGFNVKIKQLEWSAYKAALNNGEADMFWISWWADYPDAENFLFPLFHSSNHGAGGNRTRYTNSTVDRMITSGQTELNIKKRADYYKTAEKIITEDLPLLPFWHKKEFLLIQPSLKAFVTFPVYTMDKGTEVAF